MEKPIKINTDAVKNAKKVRGKPFEKGYDSRRNLQGRPEERRSFATLFEEAIEKLTEKKKLPIEDVQVELVTRTIIEALKGNYQYYKDIMDRLYGKSKESENEEIDPVKESIIKFEEFIQKLLLKKPEES